MRIAGLLTGTSSGKIHSSRIALAQIDQDRGQELLMRQSVAIMFFMLALSGCEVSSGSGTVFSGGGGPTGGQLYISTSNSILRFTQANSSSGNVAPAGVISGSNTLLAGPQHIFLDVPDNRLYVANQGGPSVLVFDKASTLNGNVSPSRVISGNATLLVAPFDVAVDPINNLLYVADGIQILVFAGATTVSGDAPPVRTITMGISMGSLLVNATDQLFASGPGDNIVDRLDGISTQNGVALVGGSISGPSTKLAQPRGLALDASGRLIVSNTGSAASITIYPNASTANGDAAPIAEITGTNTLLQFPAQIALNTVQDELFVLDTLNGSVLVFRNIATATGDVAPGRIISGPATGITPNGARGIAIDASR